MCRRVCIDRLLPGRNIFARSKRWNKKTAWWYMRSSSMCYRESCEEKIISNVLEIIN